MNHHNQQSDADLEAQAPQGLIDDVRALYGTRVAVPPQVDEAVLARAQRRFARRRMVARAVRWGVAGVAAAAVLLVAVTMWPGLRSVPAGREDIDGNGRVDILDAFTLARSIEAPDGVKKEWDLNGDGVVDRTDVDTVALAAVSLKGGAF